MSDAAELDAAYASCETLTRREAANFYYGIRLLARERRRAMCAAYAFARRVDDIGDGSLGREQKLAALEAQTRALREAERGGAPAGEDPVLVALADAHVRFALPQGALAELIEGVRMDVTGERYEDFEGLVLYCRRVAGAIGRVCLAIFGLRAGAGVEAAGAEALADDLGVALQLTNILRDVREDAEGGRIYIPAEDLRRFDVPHGEDRRTPAALAALTSRVAHGEGGEEGERLLALVRFEADRARVWFERGISLARLLDWRSAACLLAMAGIYRRLLERIAARPEEALGGRLSLPVREKAWVAARGMIAGARA